MTEFTATLADVAEEVHEAVETMERRIEARHAIPNPNLSVSRCPGCAGYACPPRACIYLKDMPTADEIERHREIGEECRYDNVGIEAAWFPRGEE